MRFKKGASGVMVAVLPLLAACSTTAPETARYVTCETKHEGVDAIFMLTFERTNGSLIGVTEGDTPVHFERSVGNSYHSPEWTVEGRIIRNVRISGDVVSFRTEGNKRVICQ